MMGVSRSLATSKSWKEPSERSTPMCDSPSGCHSAWTTPTPVAGFAEDAKRGTRRRTTSGCSVKVCMRCIESLIPLSRRASDRTTSPPDRKALVGERRSFEASAPAGTAPDSFNAALVEPSTASGIAQQRVASSLSMAGVEGGTAGSRPSSCMLRVCACPGFRPTSDAIRARSSILMRDRACMLSYPLSRKALPYSLRPKCASRWLSSSVAAAGGDAPDGQGRTRIDMRRTPISATRPDRSSSRMSTTSCAISRSP
mmetsp:Transcript_23662/g.60501  ORF Transcript_23662/g.60501 Transcript_23662/m.60501 type:complete len:256 (+) Transcript_23662:902-1669(+)